MSAAHRAALLTESPDDPRIKKGAENLGKHSGRQRLSSNGSIRLLSLEDQELIKNNSEQPEAKLLFVDLRDERQRRDEAAKRAVEDAERFARAVVEATAIALALTPNGATEARLAALLFGDGNTAGAALIDAVLRDLVERGLLKPRVREIGKPLYWIPRDQLACRAERRRLKQLLLDLGAEAEGGQ